MYLESDMNSGKPAMTEKIIWSLLAPIMKSYTIWIWVLYALSLAYSFNSMQYEILSTISGWGFYLQDVLHYLQSWLMIPSGGNSPPALSPPKYAYESICMFSSSRSDWVTQFVCLLHYMLSKLLSNGFRVKWSMFTEAFEALVA